MPSSLRLPHGRSIALTLLAVAALASLSCSGSDATGPEQPAIDDTYFRATITLLDAGQPCLPGVCPPEFYDCAGVTPITLPRTWEMEANVLSVGLPTFDPNRQLNFLALSGTDTARDTGVAVELSFDVAPDGSIASAALNTSSNSTFANVDGTCTEINTANDPVSLFGFNGPSSVSFSRFDTTGDQAAIAVRSGTGYSPDAIVEGSFSFEGQNLQRVGSLFMARVRVDACFRVHATLVEQGQPAGLAPLVCP